MSNEGIVSRATGLRANEEGFGDVKQQSYFGLVDAVEKYNSATGAIWLNI